MNESMPLKTAAKRLRMTTDELYELIRHKRFGLERNTRIVCPVELIQITQVEFDYTKAIYGI